MHKPVLIKEVLEYLDPKPNENFVDGTIGEAGHTLLILEKNGSKGKILGIDLDAGQIENARQQTEAFAGRILLVHDSYRNIKNIIEREDFKPVHGILLDLGYSSWQITESGKGFSFQKNEKLDMRYDLKNTLTAEKIVNEYPQDEIEKIIKEYGEENFAKQIAKKITEKRKIKKIETTFELKDLIQEAIPGRFGYGKNRKIHSATRTFQALRIAVNRELDNLQKALPDAVSLLPSGGRLVVISFHSLEDRIVKNFFKEQEKGGILKILTKKPVSATMAEIAKNPRSRSAKLRAIIRC